ncbi:TPA: phage regulatory protein/antirepressor Ant [Vibrio parahaemolyticus]|nr:phage regulatory protein/antirepressor Ant [Vibrio parahaemolyticus]
MLSISTQTEMTMSSREIAELTGKRHDNVRRTIESLWDLSLISVTQFEEPTVGGGKPTRVYHVNEEGSYIVVARLSPEFTAKIVKRWQELEKQSQPQVPQTFADAIAGADKGVKLGQFAKTVGLGPVTIFRVLRELKIFMSRGDSYNLPYQDYVERGYFTVKQGTYETNSQTRISHTALITGKGEIWLRKKLLETGHLKAVAA